MFNNFDTNISCEEYYSNLYNNWEVDDDERGKKFQKNKQTDEEVTRRACAMASF